MLRIICVLMAASVSALIASAGAQPAPRPSGCSLHVHITDEDGADLPKAFLFIHSEHGANQEPVLDRTGQVKISLHAGMYDLFVSAAGFQPQAHMVDLRSCKPAEVNLMLTIDAEHTENSDP
jgi:hypothetical protein